VTALQRLLLLAVVLLGGAFAPVQAHEVRPGYLELRQVDAEMWDLVWKVPAKGDLRLALDVELPENCQNRRLYRTLAHPLQRRADRTGDRDCRPAGDAHRRAGTAKPRRRHCADGAPHAIGADLYRQR